MKIKLHTQIVIALILGAVFGSIFHIDQNKLSINTNSEEIIIQNWSSVTFTKKDSVIKTYESKDQLSIIKYFNSLRIKKAAEDVVIKIKYPSGQEQIIEKVKEVSKVKTIGVLLKPVGDIFIRLLTMIAVPLVLASLIAGAASLSDLKHIAKIDGKTIGFYSLTRGFAISIGLFSENIIQSWK